MNIDKELYRMIFKRKSFHLFQGFDNRSITANDVQNIEETYQNFLPLNADIKTGIKIVAANETTCRRGEQFCVLLYSEKKDNYLQNIGYLREQLDLYLVSRNIGTLWFGIGKTESAPFGDLDFVIMIAISKIDDESKFRKDMFKSKRKGANEIWSGEDIQGVTDIVRFAPSACNTQPWFIKHENSILRVYRYKKSGKRGIMPANQVTFYNRIDIGIFLCFLDLCLQHEKIQYKVEYITDNGLGDEMNLNAVYKISASIPLCNEIKE